MLRKVLKPIAIVAILVLFFIPNLAKSNKSVTPEMIQQFQQQLDLHGTDRALLNAVTNTDMKQLTLNRELFNNHNDVFSFRIKTEGVTDQKSTGRCWMFAGFNIMRPAVIKKYHLSGFEFSETYLFFWDKLEKANTFLELMIENAKKDLDDREMHKLFESPVADGGWWNYFVALVEKYGVVPKEVMPETVTSEKSANFTFITDNLLRQDALELRQMVIAGAKEANLMQRKSEMLAEVYRLLVYHFGVPPANFVWKYRDKDDKVVEKNYTPQSFYQEVVGVDLSQYVTIMDHAMHPYNKYYEISYCRNFIDQNNMTFVNLEISRLKELTLATLLDSVPVWFAADVKYDMDNKSGIMEQGIWDYPTLFRIKPDLSKKERLLTQASTPNHGMVFIGVDLVDGKPVKWLVENSWGTDVGKSGLYAMYDNWFDQYVFTIIIQKSRLPQDVLNLLKTKPIMLPPWDPMMNLIP